MEGRNKSLCSGWDNNNNNKNKVKKKKKYEGVIDEDYNFVNTVNINYYLINNEWTVIVWNDEVSVFVRCISHTF